MVAASVTTALTPAYLSAVLGSGAMGGAFLAVLHANSIGLSGPGFTVEAMVLTSRRAMRAYLIGRNTALVLVAVPLFAAISFGLAAMAGHPAVGFLGLAVDLAGIGAGLALGNIFAVVLAYPVERRLSSPVPNASEGFTGNALAATFGSLLGVAVAAGPVVAAAVLTTHVTAVVRMPLLLACAVAYGIGLAWAGVRIAANAAQFKLPELCQIAARSKL
jgi:ABC-2 type transport system permease protein